jgi:hypothetical protein
LQENNQPGMMKETCGLPLSVSFAQLDQDIACSKMYPDSYLLEKNHNVWMTDQQDIFGTYTPFSETWPKQGIMLDGVCWERMTVELGTDEKGSGFMHTPTAKANQLSPSMVAKGSGYLPTPNTMDHLPCRSQEAIKRQFATSRKGRTSPANLREWINPEMWPTPAARDFRSGQAKRIDDKKRQNNLNDAVVKWPTPTASDHRDRGGPSTPCIKKREEKGKSIELSMKVDGALNPDWVEWLMSWPIGWTSLEPLESDEILNPSIEPDIPRVTKVTKNRAARLKAIGNGQFSLCVVKAWKLLTDD